jgi:hypothetical protein
MTNRARAQAVSAAMIDDRAIDEKKPFMELYLRKRKAFRPGSRPGGCKPMFRFLPPLWEMTGKDSGDRSLKWLRVAGRPYPGVEVSRERSLGPCLIRKPPPTVSQIQPE